ncbi:uncharacterized protein [Watersipora subatra]|uniref:uncharacterized protein n=1 Tax=Watersipora subatra TaxID=2589382 RepID=UPI00355BBFB4
MSYDLPFYETDNRQIKEQMIMEQTGADEATVASLLREWKEENIDIDALLRANTSHGQLSQTTNPNSPYQSDHQVPTFTGSNTRRPNALDLTRTVKFEPRSCQEMDSQMRSTSPHTSPYRPNSCNGGTVFSYSNGMSRQLPAPVSPGRQATPTTPYSAHSQQMSPISPHAAAANAMQSMAGMSPHSARSSSCSPVPYNMSTVFSRYAGDSSIESYMGGYSTSLKRQDKNTENYRAKRERNNVAVRRSREKKKQREIENEMRVQELSDENSKLQNRLDVVLKEMKLLKSLYENIGVSLPTDTQMKIERELAKLTS